MKSQSIIALAVLLVAAFAGVSVIGDDSSAETTGYAVSYIVDGKTYTVPQQAGEGVTPGTVTLATLGEIGAFAPQYKTFVSWTTQPDGQGTAYTAGSTLIIGDGQTATLYANFEWTIFHAKFMTSAGSPLATIDGTMETGHQVDLARSAPAAPAIEGKIFAGWMPAGGDKAVKTADLGTLSADATYTATYVTDFKVTFIDGDKTYTSKVSDLTVPDVGDRTGFTFFGWFVGTEQVQDPRSFDFKEDTTFTAKWEPMNVYVTFVAGSFETTVAVLYGQTVVVPELPKGFVKWDFDFSKPITEDITVKAIEAAPAKPTGMSDPVIMTVVILIGVLALAGVAGLVVLQRKGKIVIGRGPNAKKAEEEKKE